VTSDGSYLFAVPVDERFIWKLLVLCGSSEQSSLVFRSTSNRLDIA